MKKIDLKISLLVAFICLISGFFVVPYQMETLKVMNPEQYNDFISTTTLPMSILLIIASMQLFLVSFILSFIGTKLARKTNFSLNILEGFFHMGKIVINKNSMLLSVFSGMVVALMIVVADRFYFQYQIPLISEYKPQFSFIGLIVGIFYGGVFEEIIMRLFFMSFIIWLFIKIFKYNKEHVPNTFYWMAIILSSVLFAVGHLPATEMLFGGFTTTLVIRGLMLNGIGGLFFGYLYWKKGLEYAILAHMFAHISIQLIFIPIFY